MNLRQLRRSQRKGFLARCLEECSKSFSTNYVQLSDDIIVSYIQSLLLPNYTKLILPIIQIYLVCSLVYFNQNQVLYYVVFN